METVHRTFQGKSNLAEICLMKQILTSSVTVLRELSPIFKFVIILGIDQVKFWLLKFVFVNLMLPNRTNMYADVCLWLCTLVSSCTCVLLAKEKFIDCFILTQQKSSIVKAVIFFKSLIRLFFFFDQGHCNDLLIFQTQPYSLLR